MRLTGPFEIIQRNRNGTYHVKDSSGVVLKKAYSGNKFRRYEIRHQKIINAFKNMIVVNVTESLPRMGRTRKNVHKGDEFPRLVDASEEED